MTVSPDLLYHLPNQLYHLTIVVLRSTIRETGTGVKHAGKATQTGRREQPTHWLPMPSALTTVYIIRHGTSEWNLLKKWQGQVDTNLAPEGEAQAKATGAAMRKAGVRIDAMRCSDLKRASRTAELLAAACGETSGGRKIQPITELRLRECSLGVFEGLHKDEIFGPRFARLFARLASLPHEARIRTAYFEGLETPLQVSERALAAAHDLAASVPPGATVACVTHSLILEALCACAFHKEFDSVHTKTLARLRCTWSPSTGFQLLEADDVEFAPAPDALADDAGAQALTPCAARSGTGVHSKNTIACAVGLGAALATGLASLARRIEPTHAVIGSLASALSVGSSTALLIGGAVYDARSAAVMMRATICLLFSFASSLAAGCVDLEARWPLAFAVLDGARVAAIAQASVALCLVFATELLVALGWRASLYIGSAPLGLWLPRLKITKPSLVTGAGDEVGRQTGAPTTPRTK